MSQMGAFVVRSTMKRKLCHYTTIGLLIGGAATGLIGVLALKPLAQAQISLQPPLVAPSSPTMPRMRGMMAQPDQHFIVMMIPHHEGAIAMADLALQRSQRTEIRTLAQSIKETQSREIQQMRTWYRQWYNTDVPEWVPGMGRQRGPEQPQGRGYQSPQGNRAPGMGWHRGRMQAAAVPQSGWQAGGCMGMNTMLGDTTALRTAADVDRAFIEMMIPHHQMGVRMANMVLATSTRAESRTLAQTIIDTQTAEINQMQQWYQDWYQ